MRYHLWRALIVALVAVVMVPAALLFEFLAAVVHSDCFLTCTGTSHHALGIALALLSATTLTCVPLIGAVLWRSRRAYIGTGWFGVVAAAAAVLGLG